MKKQTESAETQGVIKELIGLLKKGNAHASFDAAVKDLPFDDIGKKLKGLPYSIWQLTEHVRITQNDILEFSFNKNYKERKWPDDYWPKEAAPENEAAWRKSTDEIKNDLKNFIELLKDEDADLLTPFAHGNSHKNNKIIFRAKIEGSPGS